MKLSLRTFKWMWVVYRKRKIDNNIAPIGVYHTKKEAVKMVGWFKRSSLNKNVVYTIEANLFHAHYEKEVK